MKIKSILLLAALVLTFASCTDNFRARHMGGNMDIDLPKGEKLVTATWKEQELWYLTRPAKDGESPETSVFHEKSTFGALQGTVTFRESN